MNRPIKYRGKQLDNGEMIYGFYAYKAETDEHFIIQETISLHRQSYFTDYKVDPETVGQYVGRTDSNGNEIYEQDIVKFRKYKNDYTGVVSYKMGCFIAKWESVVGAYGEKASHSEYLKFCEDIEVIGSIYTHPHLLEVSEA